MRKPYALKNRNGRRVIRLDAKRNARPKKLHVLGGGHSKVLRDVAQELDGRTRRGKHERRTYRRLVRAHGGPKHITPELDLLLRSLARIETLSLIASDAIAHSGSVGAGSLTSGSTDALLRAVRELRDLLAHPALASLAMPALAAGRDVVTMSDEELEYLARGEAPPPMRPEPALRPLRPEPAPLLLLPAPTRPRIKSRDNAGVKNALTSPVQGRSRVDAGEAGLGQVASTGKPSRGSQPDDLLAVDRWDSPWRMRP